MTILRSQRALRKELVSNQHGDASATPATPVRERLAGWLQDGATDFRRKPPCFVKNATGLIVSACILAACTYVPFETGRVPERALPVADTAITRGVADLVDTGHPDKVLLAPLTDGNDALAARFRLMERAERSIDIQTFLIKPDTAGALFWLSLYEAAERGVKIRLLYDDVFTSASDAGIATLDAHPNVEIRTFNPLSRNSTVWANFLLDFKRVNRRMHNKSMIVDGAVAVVGGRNIADEYYQIETSNEFADFDLLMAGRPVENLSDAFDLYWNDGWSVPIASFAEGDEERLAAAYDSFLTTKESPEAQIYAKAMASEYVNDLRAGRLQTYTGTAVVVVDDPLKLRTPPGQGPFIAGDKYFNTLLSAKSEVLIFTPYFVPEDYGAKVFETLADRGVRVQIVTNSLAATNHAYVHGGYAPYRERLLSSGVEFYEVRADAPKLVGGSDAGLVLHSKVALVDRRRLFVGSTNIDPRSFRQNTEVGVVIDSPELVANIRSRFDARAPDYVFRVQKADNGALQWTYDGGGRAETFDREPGATAWDKLIAALAYLLPVESQL